MFNASISEHNNQVIKIHRNGINDDEDTITILRELISSQIEQETSSSQIELLKELVDEQAKWHHLDSKQLYNSDYFESRHPLFLFNECTAFGCFLNRYQYPGNRLMIENVFARHLRKHIESGSDQFHIGIHGIGGFFTEMWILARTLNTKLTHNPVLNFHITNDKMNELVEEIKKQINEKNTNSQLSEYSFNIEDFEFPDYKSTNAIFGPQDDQDDQDDQENQNDHSKSNYFRAKFFMIIRLIQWIKTLGFKCNVYLYSSTESFCSQNLKMDALIGIDYVDQFYETQKIEFIKKANLSVNPGGLIMMARTDGLMQRENLIVNVLQRKDYLNSTDDDHVVEYIDSDEHRYNVSHQESFIRDLEFANIILSEKESRLQEKIRGYIPKSIVEKTPEQLRQNDFSAFETLFGEQPAEYYAILLPIQEAETMTSLQDLIPHLSKEPTPLSNNMRGMYYQMDNTNDISSYIVRKKLTGYDNAKKDVEKQKMEIHQIYRDYLEESTTPLFQLDGTYWPLIMGYSHIFKHYTAKQTFTAVFVNIPIAIVRGLALGVVSMTDTFMSYFGYYRRNLPYNFYIPHELKTRELSEDENDLGDLNDLNVNFSY